jgi:hypothetical protein
MTVQSDAPPTTGDETNHAGKTLPGGCPITLATTLHARSFRRNGCPPHAQGHPLRMFDFTAGSAHSEPMGGLGGPVGRGAAGAQT